ncbi:hypothetical protein HP532_20375 [Pseudomonas sp. CrR25]|nr:hypothetical protein [Pseudomonas sp. CrR25]
MRIGLVLLLVWSGLLRADDGTWRAYHELRSRAYLVCANAAVYFDPQVRQPDSRNRAAYLDGLWYLDSAATELGQPAPLQAHLAALRAAIAALERQTGASAAGYRELLHDLLQARERLDGWAAQGYQGRAGELPETVRQLHRQSLDSGRLLLAAQSGRVPGLGVGQEQGRALDQAIERRFDELLERLPGQVESLRKLHLNYRFVRAQLLQPSPERMVSPVLYLTRTLVDLDELAEAIQAQP